MAPQTAPPLILKVGGSLVQSGRIDQVVSIIAESQRAVVIVPGGGEFADKVRDLQAALHFDDGAAHRLAMLGMHQMADTLVTKHARFVIEDSLEGLFLAIADGRIPIWVPLPTLDGDDTIPATWDTTSDTIAARLAELLGGAPLALLKSVNVRPEDGANQLASGGVVDRAFPVIVARANILWRVFGPDDDADVMSLLMTPDAPVSKS